MSDLDIVGLEAIRDDIVTGAYFERTEATLRHAGENPRVVAEVTADQFPDGDFELSAGVKDAAELLTGHDTDVDAVPEGTLFDGGPVTRVEDDYLEFARLETSLLGFLSRVSGCATAALEVRSATLDPTVPSSGAQHIHPAIAVMIERNALVAGPDGFSHAAAGEIPGKEVSGIMSHTFLTAFGRGNQAEAFHTFDEAVDEDMPRVAFRDIYGDEAEEVFQAVGALDDDLDSVCLDITSSRHGDSRHIVREVRWELDACGHEDVGIFVSGGLGLTGLRHLRDVVEGFGVGGHISNVDPVDFVLDIVEVNGESAAKRGKLSGVEEAYRTVDGGHHVGLHGRPGPTDGESLLGPLIYDGEVVSEFDFDIDAAAMWVSEDAESVGLGGVSEK